MAQQKLKPRSMHEMRRVEVAELVLLAVALLLAAALLLQCCLGRGTSYKRRAPPSSSSSELPLSRPPVVSPPTNKQSLLLTLCSGRPRANSAEASPARWFAPASRALYTIDEADEEEVDGERTRDEQKPEPETPFYTPPN